MSVNTVAILISTYFLERALKLEFISLKSTQRMQNEVTEVLEKLPEGILLYNPETSKVQLVNQEFKRMFCKDYVIEDISTIEKELNKNIIKPYSF